MITMALILLRFCNHATLDKLGESQKNATGCANGRLMSIVEIFTVRLRQIPRIIRTISQGAATMKVVDINMSNACATLSRVPKRFT